MDIGDLVAVAVDQVGVLTTAVVRGLDRMREAFDRQAPPGAGGACLGNVSVTLRSSKFSTCDSCC